MITINTDEALNSLYRDNGPDEVVYAYFYDFQQS